MFLSPGFPSPVSSSVSSPSVQPPVYLWGPTWAVSKPRARLSLVGMHKETRGRVLIAYVTHVGILLLPVWFLESIQMNY